MAPPLSSTTCTSQYSFRGFSFSISPHLDGRYLMAGHFHGICESLTSVSRIAPLLEMLLRLKRFVCHKSYLSYRWTIDSGGGDIYGQRTQSKQTQYVTGNEIMQALIVLFFVQLLSILNENITQQKCMAAAGYKRVVVGMNRNIPPTLLCNPVGSP